MLGPMVAKINHHTCRHCMLIHPKIILREVTELLTAPAKLAIVWVMPITTPAWLGAILITFTVGRGRGGSPTNNDRPYPHSVLHMPVTCSI